jgi:5'-nucleotidase
MAGSKLIHRREFIKAGAFAGAFVIFNRMPFNLFPVSKTKKITILHTNDMHSRIEPYPLDGGKFQGLGGMAARAEMIKKVRKVEKNILLLDAGDILQGTPYFNFFKGEVEFRLMSEIKYDAATFGNHEFDGGIENLANKLKFAKFPFIVSNYDFAGTPLEGKTTINKIVEVDGYKIGIYGLGIDPKGLIPDELFGKIQFMDPLKVALEQEKLLKDQHQCDLIICLSHLGLEYENGKISDIEIAKNTNTTNLVLGGHTHVFMKEPREIKNKSDKNCYVFQVGHSGIKMGRVDFILEAGKEPKYSVGMTYKIV